MASAASLIFRADWWGRSCNRAWSSSWLGGSAVSDRRGRGLVALEGDGPARHASLVADGQTIIRVPFAFLTLVRAARRLQTGIRHSGPSSRAGSSSHNYTPSFHNGES